MYIISERHDWEGKLTDFPANVYLDILNNFNIPILRYGNITGSKVFDLFIVFKYEGKNFNFAMDDNTGVFKIQSKEGWEASGTGSSEFKEIINRLVTDKTFLPQSKIFSFTLKELYDARDGDFIHHDQYTAELSEPTLLYAYANTLVFEIKSSHYGQKEKNGGTNITKYKVFVLFEDFYTIGKDKDIDFEDAIDYAIDWGDVHIRCNCKAFLYWGAAYISTKMRYLYGVPRENRFPKVRNPNLKGTICKHCDAVIQWILKHKDIIGKMFATYYNRLNDGQSIYAVNTNGTTITIGKKNEEGDIFFERQAEEQEDEMLEEEITDEETIDEILEETGPEEETDEIGDPDDWFADDDNVIEGE